MVTDFALVKLDALMPGLEKAIVPQLLGTTEFESMTVLVSAGANYNARHAATRMGATDVIQRGELTRFALPIEQGFFQVDLVRVPGESLPFALNYLAMDAHGSLIGRLAQFAGFQLTPLGLVYPTNSRGQRKMLPVTTDWRDMLELLGYSDPAHRLGMERDFRTISDVFRYVATSRYGSPAAFLAGHQRGDSLPEQHRAFLYWLAAQGDDGTAAYDWSCKAGVQQVLLDEALAKFAGFRADYGA